jgi:hypothetical protein
MEASCPVGQYGPYAIIDSWTNCIVSWGFDLAELEDDLRQD